MRGDFSRIPTPGPKHFRGVLHQQGRVWLDSDWNEAVLTHLDDHRRAAADLVGIAGAPATGPGFQVRPFDDPARQLDFLIGAGRFYVHGLECRLDADTPYSAQPDFPAAPPIRLPVTNAQRAVVYLDVWERLITQIEDGSLLEVALGGPDTTARLKTTAQVKILPLSDDTLNGSNVGTVLPKAGQGTLRTLQPANVTPGDPCRLPDPTNFSGPENRLYRVEVHNAGDVLSLGPPTNPPTPTRVFRSKLAQDATTRLLVLQDNLAATQTAVLQSSGVANLVDDDGQAETVSIAAIGVVAGQTQVTLATDLQGTFKVAKNATLLGGVTRFKWSRDNASFAVTITGVSADGQTVQLSALGRDDASALRELDLVEVSDDASELGSRTGFLTTVAANPDPDALTVTLSTPLPANTFDPARHMTLRRWDGVGWAGDTYSDTGTPDMNLGDGVHVQFGGSDLRPGDYWVFAARTADGSVEPLSDAPPAGPKRHVVPLAIVRWSSQTWFPVDSIIGVVNLSDRPDAPLKPLLDRLTQLKAAGIISLDGSRVSALARTAGVNPATIQTIGQNLLSLGTTQGQVGATLVIEEDCRVIFPPLAEPAIRVVDIQAVKTGLSVVNDSDVSVDDLVNGLNVVCSETIDPASLTETIAGTTVSSKPVCQFTAVVPFPFPESDKTVWGTAPLGSLFLSLASTVALGGDHKTIVWQPTPGVVSWLQQLLFQKAAAGADRVLAHLTIKGNFIWSNQDATRLLAGGTVGLPRATGRTGVRLPAGPPVRGSDFTMWLWLLKSATAAVPRILTLTVDTPQTTGGTPSATGSIKLTIPAPNDIAVPLTSNNPAVTFANNNTVTILKGTDNATFPIITHPVLSDTQVTITATLPPTNPPSGDGPHTTTITVLHPTIAAVTLNPPRVPGGIPSTGTITLTGPLPATGITLSATSNNAAAVVGTQPATSVAAPTQATFPITTTVVRSITQVQISASIAIPSTGFTFNFPAQTLTVQGGLFALSLTVKTIFVSQNTAANVSLSCPSFDATVINLSTSNAAAVALSTPALTIPAGQTDASFQVVGIAPATGITVTATQAGLPPQSDTLTVTTKPKETKEHKDGKDGKEHKDAKEKDHVIDNKLPEKSLEIHPKGIHVEAALPERHALTDFPAAPLREGDLAAMVRMLARRLDEMEERVSVARSFIRPEERPAVGHKAFDDSSGDGNGRAGDNGNGSV
jgi:hypothetical protein